MLQPSKRIDSYDLTMVPMGAEHLDRLCELSMAVRWPHRFQDWEMVQGLGSGVVALDEIGRLVSSAMVFPMGGERVNIGMMITSPRLQDQGNGRWLMDEMLARSEGKLRVLNATKEGYRLYLSLGFQPLGRVWQMQGVAKALPGADARVRPAGAEDQAAIRALDLRAFGSARVAVLDSVLPRSQALVLEEAGRIEGFALCRPFGRGHVIGPVVARTEEEAVALIRPHIARHPGRFLRMDTHWGEGVLKAALEAAGLVYYDNVTTMSLGGEPQRDMSVHTFGLVSHALG